MIKNSIFTNKTKQSYSKIFNQVIDFHTQFTIFKSQKNIQNKKIIQIFPAQHKHNPDKCETTKQKLSQKKKKKLYKWGIKTKPNNNNNNHTLRLFGELSLADGLVLTKKLAGVRRLKPWGRWSWLGE